MNDLPDPANPVAEYLDQRIEYNAWLDRVEAGEHSPTLEEYVRWDRWDSNLFWRLSSGDVQNLLDAAIERLEAAGLLRAEGDCGACWHCHDESGRRFPIMFLCPDCGDKRCARARDHRQPCDIRALLPKGEA